MGLRRQIKNNEGLELQHSHYIMMIKAKRINCTCPVNTFRGHKKYVQYSLSNSKEKHSFVQLGREIWGV